MRLVFLFFLLLLTLQSSAQQDAGLIPAPRKFTPGKGCFQLSDATSIGYNNQSLQPIAYYFQNEALNQAGLTIEGKPGKTTIALNLVSNSRKQDSSGYSINITTNHITVSASHPRGIFYGVISLLQMAATSKNNQLPVCTIVDAPVYEWRGFMLDESRHFFGKQKVKSILNWMAFYKLNVFHWHLTDEPAWRLEIKKYPDLTLVGGTGDYLDPNLKAQYYSQADVREIISYAAQRFIKVIPEIDMPGHATAANRAYPSYSGGGSPAHPEFTFNPGNEDTYAYLTNILKEVNILFPYKLIHLGGDEVSYGNAKWKTDAGIANLHEKEKLKDDVEVERYFMKRMADSVYHLNAKVLVWDEMAGADLPKDKTIIFWWRHDKLEQLTLALHKGYQTVLCPRLPFYFDFVQDSTHRYGRKWDGAYNSLQQVYNFDARSFTNNNRLKPLIVGLQANLWTETVDSEQRLDYLLFPRIAALAEAAWTDSTHKNYAMFSVTLQKHLDLYSKAGLYFYNPNQPLQNPELPVKRKKPLNYKD